MRRRPGTVDVWDSDRVYRQRFDGLFQRGRRAVLDGAHVRDSTPVDGGRWGMSVVFLPDEPLAGALEAITGEAMTVAGPGHWATGRRDAVHFTVRAVEAYRSHIPAGDPLVARYTAALHETAVPVRMRVEGLTLTPSGVMVCAYPRDRAAADFSARLGERLGSDGWFEETYPRNIWYATLVHFADAITNRQALVEWVTQRRNLAVGEATFDRAHLVRFEHTRGRPVRVTGGCGRR